MRPTDRRRVLMALFFFPRGGSAHAARLLAGALPASGWEVAIAAGSLGAAGEPTHAASFYAGLDVTAVDYGAGLGAADPPAGAVPFQPSYEDRPGAPDRVFAAVGDRAYERLVEAWEQALGRAGAGRADVLHLHHLTPVNEAAARAFPQVPVLGQLHGTELGMLREIGAAPRRWPHADAWVKRLRRWAAGCDRLMVPTRDAAERAGRLLGVEPDQILQVPNAVDLGQFQPGPLAAADRLAHWRRWLVEDPQGWDHSGVPGSVRYHEEDLAAIAAGGPVLLYVGRFTAVKRVPLLVRAYAQARRRFAVRAPLVLLGGFPGEFEERHPLDEVRDLGVPDVFLAGWRPHGLLPAALNAADLLVLPSVREQFGLVLIEAMACGLPVVAVDAHGPAGIVDPGQSGWLVPPDDQDALADALVDAVNDAAERRRRGAEAREAAGRYSHAAVARAVARAYQDLASG
ncbi:MAG TPA: glycosyltransferase family 4 protein [Actinomycetes bacterium]